MKEQYWKSLTDYIEKEERKKEREIKRSQHQLERIRKQLEEKARDVVTSYQEISARLKPEAEERLNDVVIPWWREISNSGFAAKLSNLMKSKGPERLNITEPYYVFWPFELWNELKSPFFSERPFGWQAKQLITNDWGIYKESSLEERVNEKLEWMEVELVSADMHFRQIGSGLELVFYYGRGRPISCGFNPDRYTLPFPINQKKLPNTNPSVVIDFAKQIEEKKVEKAIEKGIKSKREMYWQEED